MGSFGSSSLGSQFDIGSSPFASLSPSVGLSLGLTPGGGSTPREVDEVDDEEDDSVEVPLTQPPYSQQFPDPHFTQEQSSSGPRNWSLAENEALVSAYMNTSADSVTGTYQTKEQFWRKVVEKYEEVRQGNPTMPVRTPKSLRSRWNRISVNIMAWVGCYDEAKRRQASGQNEDDVLREAHLIHERTVGGRFTLERNWRQLQLWPRWQNLVTCEHAQRPRSLTPTSGQGSDSSGKRSWDQFQETSPSTCERPEGSKKAKAKQRGKAQMSSEAVNEVAASIDSKLDLVTDVVGSMKGQLADYKAKKLHERQFRSNWKSLTALKKMTNRNQVEEKMLQDLYEWFNNNSCA